MGDDVADDDGYTRTFDTDKNQPTVDITETVAELRDVESDELSPLYDSIDHVVDNIFSEPPRPEADVEVSFNYEGYRIAVRQDGHATFRPRE